MSVASSRPHFFNAARNSGERLTASSHSANSSAMLAGCTPGGSFVSELSLSSRFQIDHAAIPIPMPAKMIVSGTITISTT